MLIVAAASIIIFPFLVARCVTTAGQSKIQNKGRENAAFPGKRAWNYRENAFNLAFNIMHVAAYSM